MRADDLSWAAGLFEGEGTIRINKPTHRNLGALLCSVVNTDRQIVDWFQERWPGYMKAAHRPSPHHKPAWVWVIAGNKAAKFLMVVQPHLKTQRMRSRADLGLEFQAQKQTSALVNRLPGYRHIQEAYYWDMRELNRRGAIPTCPKAEEFRR